MIVAASDDRGRAEGPVLTGGSDGARRNDGDETRAVTIDERPIGDMRTTELDLARVDAY